jgi:hypothetical protein
MHNPILAAVAITIGVAALIFWPRIERLLAPTQPEEPDTSDGQEERPASGSPSKEGLARWMAWSTLTGQSQPITFQEERPASGADENWSPLHDVANAEKTDQPAPDFDTNIWLVDVHSELNALEDAFRHDVEHLWGRFYDWLGVDARTRLRLPSSIEHTAEFPVVVA